MDASRVATHYRPIVVVAVAVLLIVFVPAERRKDSSTQTQAGGRGPAVSSPEGGPLSQSPAGTTDTSVALPGQPVTTVTTAATGRTVPAAGTAGGASTTA